MSLQLGAIGWLVTSENAQAYLAKNKKIIWFLLTAIGFLVFAHISMIIDGFKVSEELVEAIEKNSFYSECIKEQKIFELYKLKSSSVLLRGIFTTTLFGVLAFFIASVREDFKKHVTHGWYLNDFQFLKNGWSINHLKTVLHRNV